MPLLIEIFDQMEEAIVEQFLGHVFVKTGFLIQIVEQWNVDASAWLHTVTQAAQYADIDFFLGGDLLDHLQEHLFLEAVFSSMHYFYHLSDLIQIIVTSLDFSSRF